MLDYPNNFDADVFPKARKIALTRTLAIWSLIAFFVIACLCGLLLWGVNSKRLSPILISVSEDAGRWTAISESGAKIREYPADIMMQESVVGKFAQMWFRITGNIVVDEATWTKCIGEKNDAAGECFLCCMSADMLYRKFEEDVLPVWRQMAASGEIMGLDPDSIVVSNVSASANKGGTWRIEAVLHSNKSGPKNIIAFVRTARAVGTRPMTLGFYVVNFNAYAIK